MAGNGRRAKRSGNTVLRVDGELRGFDLPDGPSVLAKGMDWNPLARRKWDVWRRSPMAQRWDESDWDFALETLIVFNNALRTNSTMAFAEVRQRESMLGQTYSDRVKLKLETPGADDFAVHDANAEKPNNDFEKYRQRRAALG